MEHQFIDVRRPPTGTARVALFVDGDNLSSSLSSEILLAAGALGRTDLRRVYCADNGPKGWDTAAGFRVIRVAGAKNGTDLLLCIEAVEAACRGEFDHFVIASDDRDFSHLAHWLRERGVPVLGLGTSKSPEGWRAACSAFELLSTPPAPSTRPVLSELDRKLKAAIGRASDGQDVVKVGNAMTQAQQRPPEGCTWRSYMMTRTDLFDLDPRGPKAKVRWIGG